MQLKTVIKAFLLGFFLVVFLWSFFFFKTSSSSSALQGYVQLTIDKASATSSFFSKLRSFSLTVITAESVFNIPPFNTADIPQTYFIDNTEYLPYFYSNPNLETCYIKNNITFFQWLSIVWTLKTQTKEWYFEKTKNFSFLSCFISIVFFIFLLCRTQKKLLFTVYSLPFLLFSVYAIWFSQLVSVLFFLSGIFFFLSLFTFKIANLQEFFTKNSLLFFLILFAFVLPFFSPSGLIPFIICLILFIIIFLLVKDLNSLYIKEQELKTEHRHVSPYGLSKKQGFLYLRDTVVVTISLVGTVLVSFCIFFLFSGNSNKQNTILQTYKMIQTDSFSTSSFFHCEEKGGAMASLNSFVKNHWYNSISPYIMVGEEFPLENGLAIYYNDYEVLSGKMTEIQKKQVQFDDDFIEKVLILIEDPHSILTLFREQNGFASFSLKPVSFFYESISMRVFVLIFALILLTVILFLTMRFNS